MLKGWAYFNAAFEWFRGSQEALFGKYLWWDFTFIYANSVMQDIAFKTSICFAVHPVFSVFNI